jgi:RHS repeat-associated protein
LTIDHLGSARVVTNENGAVVNRKDFSAFGEETVTSQRTTTPGYTDAETRNVRQDYTGYQKDEESGLEYAQARYYNTQHGRYTSVDPLTSSAAIKNPQTFNRYSYVTNSPYKFVDPLGLALQDIGVIQTSDGAFARSLENKSDQEFRESVGEQYEDTHEGETPPDTTQGNQTQQTDDEDPKYNYADVKVTTSTPERHEQTRTVKNADGQDVQITVVYWTYNVSISLEGRDGQDVPAYTYKFVDTNGPVELVIAENTSTVMVIREGDDDYSERFEVKITTPIGEFAVTARVRVIGITPVSPTSSPNSVSVSIRAQPQSQGAGNGYLRFCGPANLENSIYRYVYQ